MKAKANASQVEAQDVDLIDLGVASVETKGDLRRQEPIGGLLPMGLAND